MVTARPAVAWLSGSLFVATGLAVILSTLLPSAAPDRDVVAVRVVNALAVVAGIGMVALRSRTIRLLPHVVIAGGVVLITTALHASGGGASAVAYAAVYCLAPGYAFMLLPPRSATVHLLLTVAVGAPSLAVSAGVGPAEQVVVWSVAVLLGAVVGWMARALQRAEEDHLTGLSNRRGLERALYEAIASTGAGHLTYALLDLDHFAAWNDTRGRAAGDRLLQDVAAAWAAVLPAGWTLGRLGADEFGLVMPQTGAREAVRVLAQLHAAVPDGATCSAGLAQHEAGESASMLTARAEAAVYSAKREGRARTHEHTGGGPDGRAVLEALDRREFEVHYQPIVDPRTGRTLAAEALVRWRDPDGGLVPPSDFLPDAERSGAIVQLGAWVLRTACTAAARWTADGDGPAPYVTVNASGRELQGPSYWKTVADALAASGLPAERLVLELVESHYDVESLHLVNNLHRLRDLGVRTAIDDFGVGYSSLDRLRRSGVDILKIDKSFTDDITSASAEAPLVLAILAMGRALGLRVVAEGVETREQADWLVAHGCDAAQGWFFGRPSPRLQPVQAVGSTWMRA